MVGVRRTTTRHHGRDVPWHESSIRISALVDGMTISIQKLHPSTFRPSRGGRAVRPDAPRYRVLVDQVFVQPGWGFRRTLREAKDDGVACAMAVAAEVAEARSAFKAAVDGERGTPRI